MIIQSNLLRTLFQSTSIHMAFRTSPTRPSFNNPTPGGSATSNANGGIGGIGGIGRAISPSPHTPQARSFPHPHPSAISRPSGPGSASTPGFGPVPPGSATGTATGQGSRGGPSFGMSIKGARIIPSREGEPVSIFLPVPDPASFGVVLHWLYWYVPFFCTMIISLKSQVSSPKSQALRLSGIYD